MTATLISSILCLIIGCSSIYRAPHRLDNILFFLLTISISWWSIFNYLSLNSTGAETTLLWMRLVMLSAVMQQMFLLLFIVYHTKKRLPQYFIASYLLISVFISALTQTSLLFTNAIVISESTTRYPVINHFGIILFGIYTIGSFIYGMRLLFKSTRSSDNHLKKSSKLILYGILITFLLIIVFNFILPTVFSTYIFIYAGPIYTLPFIYLTAIAITEHNLFETKISYSIFLLVISIVCATIILGSINIHRENILMSLILVSIGFLSFFITRKIENERSNNIKLYNELSKEHEELLEKHLANMEYISDLAHRLKTPLAIIQAQSGSTAKPNRATLNEINRVAKTTAITMRNIVSIGKIDAQQIAFNPHKTNLSKLMDEWRPDFAALLNNRRLTVNIAPNCIALIDPYLIREAMFNLLDNARKFSPERSAVTINLNQYDDHLSLSLSDQGVGLNRGEIKRIFSRHWQSKRQPKEAGSAGLGLSLVKWIIQQHRGEITVNSTLGSGTTFIINLPIPSKKHSKTKVIREVVMERAS